jgi:hypothetical protein
VLSQFCRMCKENYAVLFRKIWPTLREKERIMKRISYLFVLTFAWVMGILEPAIVLTQEIFMSDEKLTILRQSHTLHPHPEEVRDPLFTGSRHFSPAFSPLSREQFMCKMRKKYFNRYLAS